jgi:hypothetical protein
MAAAMLGVCLAGSSIGAARDYYVDGRSGSDDAPGTRERPWRSLAKVGTTTFHPGDSVNFKRGTEFEGGFEVKQSGTAAAPITFQAYDKGRPPRFTNPQISVLNGNAIRLNAGNIIIDGLFFARCPANPVAESVKKLGAVFLTSNAGHDIVRHCEMTQTPVGVTVYGGDNLIISNYIHDDTEPIQPKWGPMGVVICSSRNEVSYNLFVNYCAPSAEYGHDGGAIEINDRKLAKEDIHIHHNLSLRNQGFIEFVGNVKQNNFLIDHNVCMDYQSFLGLTGPCSNFRVEHNTVVRTLAHAEADSEDVVFWLYGEGNTNISLRNNIFVYDPARVEPMFARGQPAHSFNLFYRIDQAVLPRQANRAAYERKCLGGGGQLGPGDKLGDPLFRDLAKGDFRLTAGSPAIGSGTNLGYTLDFDKHPIPAGKPPDMGAFQFDPTRPAN